MPPLPCYRDRPVVLLTNDDGPPSASSPNIFAFCKLLQQSLGWDVKVVIPDCQKSWVGKAYAINDIITAKFFYPLEPEGLTGDVCETRRSLKEGETMEWILLSGTPATCANIALHNLFPGQIDLVIAGPNHGRNSSTAFALSSGTLGAALAGSLSIPIPGPSSGPSLHAQHIPCIALSYGVVTRPVSQQLLDLAHDIAVEVCGQLWQDWGWERVPDGSKAPVQFYSVNVPLVAEALSFEKRKVCWTNMWRSTYGQLFKMTQLSKATYNPADNPSQTSKQSSFNTAPAGPAALPTPSSTPVHSPVEPTSQQLKFQFAPSMGPLLFPPEDSLPIGTDAWAFAQGYISVVPMRAEFAVVGDPATVCEGDDGKLRVPGTIWE